MISYSSTMWRPVILESIPSESRYYNVMREFNGALLYTAPGTLLTASAYDKRYEAMYSESSGKMQLMHPCIHYKKFKTIHNRWIAATRSWYNATHTSPSPGKWLSNGTLQPVEGMWGLAGTTGVSGLSVFGTCHNPVGNLTSIATPHPSSPDVWNLHPTITENMRNLLVQAALAAMLPGIKPSLSILNTLFELKDFKTVGRSLRRIDSGLDSLRVIVQRVVSLRKGNDLRTRAATLRTILKAGSDGYLQSNFNLLPLLSDLGALRGSLVSLRREIEDLMARANIPQERHFQRTLGVEFVDNVQTASYPMNTIWVFTPNEAGREVTYNVRRFNATIRYRYTLPDYSQDQLVLRALCDRLGVNLNPAIIWNAIPWSFVVDWFAGVSRWLSQFQTKALNPTVYIDAFCYSLHTKRTINTSLTCDGFSGPVASIVEEAYERKVGLDRTAVASSFKTSGLNPKEFSLSAALLLSR